MKIHSWKTMAFLFTVATMATSNVFADNFIERHFKHDKMSDVDHRAHCHFTLEEIDDLIRRVNFDLLQIGTNLFGLFSMEGTLFRNGINPFTPDTGVFQYLDAINGTGPASYGQVAANLGSILSQLGVNTNLLAQIGNEFSVLAGLAESYGFAVNTNAPLANQQALAISWLASSQRLGNLFQAAGVTSFVINPTNGQKDNIAGLLGNFIILQSQLVQAFANVLNGSNQVGAIPGNLVSQMNAVILLRQQIASLYGTISILVVTDLACPGSK